MTYYLMIAFALVVAFVVPLLVTPHLKRIAPKVGAMDDPDSRKVHGNVMPRIGGLAIYLGFICAALIVMPFTAQLKGLLAGATLIMLLGLVDDIWGLSPKAKLLGQVAAAGLAAAGGIRVEFVTNPFEGLFQQELFSLGVFAVPVTIFWIVGVTNALNLIDGLDGLAAGTSGIAAVTIAIITMVEGIPGQFAVTLLALFLAASILGFLRYNFHPAQIFMGDSGSMFLGFTLAGLAVMGLTKGATVISLFVPIVILGIPIFDTFFAIVRRYLQGKPIFQADNGHLHHRLLDMGLSHKQTVLALYGVNLTLGASAVMLTILTTEQSLWILMGISVAALLVANKMGVTRTKGIGSAPFRETNIQDTEKF